MVNGVARGAQGRNQMGRSGIALLGGGVAGRTGGVAKIPGCPDERIGDHA